jgi:hypothetical protein
MRNANINFVIPGEASRESSDSGALSRQQSAIGKRRSSIPSTEIQDDSNEKAEKKSENPISPDHGDDALARSEGSKPTETAGSHDFTGVAFIPESDMVFDTGKDVRFEKDEWQKSREARLSVSSERRRSSIMSQLAVSGCLMHTTHMICS